MKHIAYIFTASLVFALVSCGSGDKQNGEDGVKFNPSAKESTMTDAQRAAAIAAKKASLAVTPDSMVGFTGVKFSVLPTSISKNVPANVSEKLAMKIIAIAGRNSVGGLCVNPILGLASQIDCVDRSVTGTAPQKTIVKYQVTLYCGNFITNEIYASTTFDVQGVGGSFESAALQAVNEIKNSPQISAMFRQASDKAIEWYNNPGNFTRLVDKALSEQNYALAMAILSSVPAQVTPEVYEMAVKRNAEVGDMFFQGKADKLLSQMRGAIAASPRTYNPQVEAYFRLIPREAKVFEEANKLFSAYTDSLEAERRYIRNNERDSINRVRAVEDRNAADAKELALAQLRNEKEKAAMEFELQKIKAPYEAQATLEQIRADASVELAEAEAEGEKNANTGGFLGLGKLWDGGYNLINRVMDKFEDYND